MTFVSDHFWTLVAPLLLHQRVTGGRPRINDCLALEGFLFVLHTGISWRSLPQQLGYGSCWRRLIEWQQREVWAAPHRVLLDQRHATRTIDWTRASLDSTTVAAPCGGQLTGPDPTNRGKRGCKRHVLVDRDGLPLTAVISAANVHDSRMLEAAVDAVPGVRGCRGGMPRKHLYQLHADKGYDFRRGRQSLYGRRIVPRIARRGFERRERLGRHRWVVERTLS